MEIDTLALMKMENSKGKESMFGSMVHFIWDISDKDFVKGQENGNLDLRITNCMQANSIEIRSREMESMFGTIAAYTKATSSMT